MTVTDNKILIHFDSHEISVYLLENDVVRLLFKEPTFFDISLSFVNLQINIDNFFENLHKQIGDINNVRVRLYATGAFQKLSQIDKDKLVIRIFVKYGLYFNIVQLELEQFYKKKSFLLNGNENMIEGMVHQEFRNVVICGSFQQNLKEIGEVMAVLEKRNISVLSPWTTKVVPETIGTDFILLEGQEPLINARDAWKHKFIHMNKFRKSDAIIVCNPDGIVGKGTMFEFGFMVALSKRIIFTEIPKDLSIPFPCEIGLNF